MMPGPAVRIFPGMGQGVRGLRLGGFMEDDVEMAFSKECLQCRFIADIALNEPGLFRDLVPAARTQVVEDRHVVAGFQQGVDEVGTDETGPTGN